MLCIQMPLFGAVVTFDTYGPGDTYGTIGYTIGSGQTSGDLFAPSFTGNLFEIDLALSNARGSNFVNVQLTADNNGAPGSVIESYTVVATNVFSSPGSVVQALSTLHPLLTAGTNYWLLATTDDASLDPWYFSITGATGLRYSTMSGVTTDTMAAFRVLSIPQVPEPSTLFAGLVLAGAMLSRRFRH
jgi:hypothetical protein